MAFKRRLLSKGMEDFDNGIVEEINATELEAANEETKEVMEDVALDIAAVENLSEAESALEAEVQQAEVNVAAMDGAERPEVSTVEVVNPEGQVVEEEATVIPADVQPTLNKDSTDMEVAEAVKEQVQSMENIAGGMDFGRLANLYKDFGVRTGHIPSFESMVKNPRAEYKASLEGMKETLVKIKDAIIAFIKGIWAKIKGAWKAIVTGVKGLLAKVTSKKIKDGVDSATPEKIDEALKKSEGTTASTESYGFESVSDGRSKFWHNLVYMLTPVNETIEAMCANGGYIQQTTDMVTSKLKGCKTKEDVDGVYSEALKGMTSSLSAVKEFYEATTDDDSFEDPVVILLTSPESGYCVDLKNFSPSKMAIAKCNVKLTSKAVSMMEAGEETWREVIKAAKENLDSSKKALTMFQTKSPSMQKNLEENSTKLLEELSKNESMDKEAFDYLSKALKEATVFNNKTFSILLKGMRYQVKMLEDYVDSLERTGVTKEGPHLDKKI